MPNPPLIRLVGCFLFLPLILLATSAWSQSQTLKYTYDELGRLILVDDSKNGNRDYQYDAVGNRTQVKVMPVATPIVSPNGGTFSGPVSVSIASSTSGATIRYTTNGSDVTSSSPVYSSAFQLSSSATVKARAYKTGLIDSIQGSASFALVVAKPSITPNGGSHVGSVSVSLATSTTGASIRYTTNNVDVTETSPLYSSPFTLTTTTTVRTRAFKTGMTGSAQENKYFAIQLLPAPTGLSVRGPFSPYGGGYNCSWNAVTGATHYEVQLIGGTRLTVTRLSADSSGPRPEWVRAVNSAGAGHLAFFPK